jgi:HEAT repeat protein
MSDLTYLLPTRRLRRRGDIAGLARLLRSPDPYERAAALEELGKTEARETVEKITSMTGVEHERVRIAAARALGGIGGPRARAALERLVLDANPRVRFLAVQGLGRLRDPESAAVLRAFARDRYPHDGHPEARALAVRGLGRIGTGEAAEAIVEALGDPRPEVRSAARRALRRVKTAAARTDSVTLRGSAYERLLGKWVLRSLRASQRMTAD